MLLLDKLPPFQTITKEGLSGNLISTIPPVSAPSWSTIVSGMNPGNHGVFDFITRIKNDSSIKMKM